MKIGCTEQRGITMIGSNKRFLGISEVLKQRFGQKTVAVPLNAGLSCPNRDGKKGFGGCIYCSNELSGEFAGKPEQSLAEQFESVKKLYEQKWPNAKYVAYLQAGSNTYACPQRLREIYNEALEIQGISGLAIATRADCLGEEVLEILSELNKTTYLRVELGLQTVNDKTAEIINRGYSYKEFLQGYNSLQDLGIDTCLHIINGLPNESYEDMMQTAKEVAKLKPQEVKIHLLYVVKGTKLEKMYLSGKYTPLEKEEYIKIVCDQLEVLPPTTAIGRLTGDGDRKTLVAPLWSRDKRSVLNGIDKELSARNSYQGILYK